jgi:hypothetical protein
MTGYAAERAAWETQLASRSDAPVREANQKEAKEMRQYKPAASVLQPASKTTDVRVSLARV